MKSKAIPYAVRKMIYNASVTEIVPVHESLRILRIAPEAEGFDFQPGQYVTLGLGSWEPGDCLETQKSTDREHLIRRAYSISCPLLDESGAIVRPADMETLEFYVTLIAHARPHPPSLSPRLFQLKPGDSLWMENRARGQYTLRPCYANAHLVFVATGTGEAPHNAMIAELISQGYAGPITSLVCARYRRDLAYLNQHRQLEQQFANYRYIALTTREPENLDPCHPEYVGKRYPQDVFRNWDRMGEKRKIDLESSHIYLCGNPAMIGAPHSLTRKPHVYPSPLGMVEVLERQGFQLDQPYLPGNIHIEKYW